MADEVGLPDVQVPQHTGCSVHPALDGDRPLVVSSVPVPLLLNGNDRPQTGKLREEANRERRFDGPDAAVQEDEGRIRRAQRRAVDLVIHRSPSTLAVSFRKISLLPPDSRAMVIWPPSPTLRLPVLQGTPDESPSCAGSTERACVQC